MTTAWCTSSELSASAQAVNLPASITLGDICLAASEALATRAGGKYRSGTSTVRPARLNSGCGCLPFWVYSAWPSGWAWNWTPPTSAFPVGWGCGCSGSDGIVLPGGKARNLTVTVEGAVLDPSAYHVFSGRRLVRTDGQSWPCCQRLSDPASQPGTWQIEYTWGSPPPQIGVLAAIELGNELALAYGDDPAAIRLPQRTTHVNRRNVDVAIQDAVTILQKGLTGLPVCDLFLTTVNPLGARRPPRFVSPESLMLERP